MGYKYTGDALLGVSFNMTTPKPLDIRSVVNTLDDLYNLHTVENTYEGMLVGNLEDHNVYMLVDKSNIGNIRGWRASYEQIQVLACTAEEYELWANNTSEDYKPISLDTPYLNKDTYYYIYEDSINNIAEQSYVSQSQLSTLEQNLNDQITILQNSLVSQKTELSTEISNISSQITTLQTLVSNLESTITGLQESLTSLSDRVTTLETSNDATE